MKVLFHGREMTVSLFDAAAGKMFEFPIVPSGGDHGTVEISNRVSSVILSAKVPKEIPVYAYAMHYGANNHTDEIQGEVMTDGEACYSKEIPLKSNQSKTPQPPTDGGQSLRLLSIDQSGRLHDRVISLVKQDDKLFVTVQETYNEQLYRAGDLVVCPPMEKTRLATLETVRRMLEGNAQFTACLPEASTYQRPDLKKQVLALRYGEGLVLWFADGMNSGAVLCKDGQQHKVHFSKILTIRQGRRFLRTGEKVLFRGTESVPGKSQFRDQLVNVEVEGMFPGLVELDINLKPEDFQIS